jgi:hypothetical protein
MILRTPLLIYRRMRLILTIPFSFSKIAGVPAAVWEDGVTASCTTDDADDSTI